MANYPPYSVRLQKPDGTFERMTGTHATLVTSDPTMDLQFELTHGDADEPVVGQRPPNLLITLKQVPKAGQAKAPAPADSQTQRSPYER